MICFGVPAEANRPNQDVTSYPGRPACVTVGISGAAGEGLALVTPSSRNCPDCTAGIPAARPPNEMSTCPPIRSCNTAPLPLYGTWIILMCAIALNNSPARCDGEPTPADAKVTVSPD